MQKPTVSIVMITYNHQEFIEEAINSVLMQECNFQIELLISNDNSTDYTDSIIRKILKNHPKVNLVKYTNRTENVGMMPNFVSTLSLCKGKFIALCEGDDYWTDPFKLQKQVDFLEENPEYTFSMGIVDMFIEKTGKTVKRKEGVDPNKSETYTLKDYLKNPFSQTSSFLFRNSNDDFPEWFHNVHAGDQSLVVVKTGLKGKIKYHNELFSVYRLNESSVSFNIDRKKAKHKELFFLNCVNKFTQFRFKKIILRRKIINQLVYYTRSKNMFIRKIGVLFYLIYTKI